MRDYLLPDFLNLVLQMIYPAYDFVFFFTAFMNKHKLFLNYFLAMDNAESHLS